jgi:8-hydroxy-5-deazaflavin:NADPH oxidoreductase
MSIGIIGAGALGSNAARLLAKSGISATIANSRGPESLAGLVGELGPSIKAGSVGEAASADIVLVAVRWVDLGKALGGLPAWNGRIVIDGTNPVAFLDPNSRREGPEQPARCLWHQGDRSRRQAFQRGVP